MRTFFTLPQRTFTSGHQGESRSGASELVDLIGAEIIVSGGRGVGGAEGFEPLKGLADALGATVGCFASRRRCRVDLAFPPGWLRTGQDRWSEALHCLRHLWCRPACGWHEQLRCYRCHHHDPEAPIFDIADYGIVGDLFEVVPGPDGGDQEGQGLNPAHQRAKLGLVSSGPVREGRRVRRSAGST